MTQLSNKNISLNTIAVNPLTNEFWAAQLSPLGVKDKIFKVNPATGDTINVGRTGLGITTNAICFDESGRLFGAAGTSPAVNNLISIDTVNAAAVIIGAAGFTNINGMTFLTRSLSALNENHSSPVKFTVSQNYPNPFNSSTSLSYTIPFNADVKIVIYDLLGRQIESRYLNAMPAGKHTFRWEANSLASGVYLCCVSAGCYSRTVKLTYLR